MAGLGLSNAVDSYAQGVEWKHGQEERKRALDERSVIDEANKAAMAEIAAGSGAPVVAGAQEPAAPGATQRVGPESLLRAYEARGRVLATRGAFNAFAENEAKAVPVRTYVRNQTIDTAMQRFQVDGDVVGLVKTIDPVVFNGRKLVGVKPVAAPAAAAPGTGMGAQSPGDPEVLPLAAAGPAQSGPEAYELTYDDGTTQRRTRDQIVQGVQFARMNPEKMAELEFQAKIEAVKQGHIGAREITVARVAGDERRKTEGVIADRRDANDAADRENRVRTANISAGASRYSADQGLAAARVRAEGGTEGGKANTLQSTSVDGQGFRVGVFKNGEVRRLTINGQPVKSLDWTKQVESVVKRIEATPDGMGKSQAELKKMAEEYLASGETAAPPRPPLGSFGLDDARPSLGNFQKK